MALNDGYQLLLSASQMDIKMDFMPLIKISSLDLNQLSLTISPILCLAGFLDQALQSKDKVPTW